MQSTKDPFSIFDVPRRFDLDLGEVEKKYRSLSKIVHPDRRASSSSQDRRLSLNKSIEINEAWRVLNNPFERAKILFQLAGADLKEDELSKLSEDQLLEVMEMRENLSDAMRLHNSEKINQIKKGLEQNRDFIFRELSDFFLNEPSIELVKEKLFLLSMLRYNEKIFEEISLFENEMD